MAVDIDAFMKKRKEQSASALADGLPNDETNKALDRAHDAQFNIATHTEDIVLVDVNRLRPYAKHPFKIYSEERLNALADSIARDGLQQPIIIRSIDGVVGWEILAGHNRVEAMKRLDKRDIPAIVRELTDDQAALVVVETNLKQREKLLPSEKAFAYKLQMEALQRQGVIIQNGDLPSDSNGLEDGVQIGHQGKSRECVAESNGVHWHEIQRYVRLIFLLPNLLDLLDQDIFPVMAGYEISFLDTDIQQEVYLYFFESGAKDKLTLKHAEAIRAAYQIQTAITCETIPSILYKPKKKPGPQNLTIPSKLLKRYAIPKGTDIEAAFHEFLQERFGLAENT